MSVPKWERTRSRKRFCDRSPLSSLPQRPRPATMSARASPLAAVPRPLAPPAMREPILADQTHAFVRDVAWRAAVLPFGATEPHNLHMPYGTDTFQVEDL